MKKVTRGRKPGATKKVLSDDESSSSTSEFEIEDDEECTKKSRAAPSKKVGPVRKVLKPNDAEDVKEESKK